MDEGCLGGAVDSLTGASELRGRGSERPMMLDATSPDGQARAAVVNDGKGATFARKVANRIDTQNAYLMTDGARSVRG